MKLPKPSVNVQFFIVHNLQDWFVIIYYQRSYYFLSYRLHSICMFIVFVLQYMTMMFEVADLAVASPATVSRCGMVYLEPSILGLSPFVECWLKKLPDALYEYHDRLKTLFDHFLQVGFLSVINLIVLVRFLLLTYVFDILWLMCNFMPLYSLYLWKIWQYLTYSPGTFTNCNTLKML